MNYLKELFVSKNISVTIHIIRIEIFSLMRHLKEEVFDIKGQKKQIKFGLSSPMICTAIWSKNSILP